MQETDLPDATTAPPVAVRVDLPKWDGVFLVCEACGKRRKVPKSLKAKAMVALVRRAAKGGPRARVVRTGCLGLCPKGAAALAWVGAGSGPRIAAVRSKKELAATVVALRGAAASPST